LLIFEQDFGGSGGALLSILGVFEGNFFSKPTALNQQGNA
jgi:hypothetical protein